MQHRQVERFGFLSRPGQGRVFRLVEMAATILAAISMWLSRAHPAPEGPTPR